MTPSCHSDMLVILSLLHALSLFPRLVFMLMRYACFENEHVTLSNIVNMDDFERSELVPLQFHQVETQLFAFAYFTLHWASEVWPNLPAFLYNITFHTHLCTFLFDPEHLAETTSVPIPAKAMQRAVYGYLYLRRNRRHNHS